MMAFGGGKWRSFSHRPTDRPRRPFYRSPALSPASLQLFLPPGREMEVSALLGMDGGDGPEKERVGFSQLCAIE